MSGAGGDRPAGTRPGLVSLGWLGWLAALGIGSSILIMIVASATRYSATVPPMPRPAGPLPVELPVRPPDGVALGLDRLLRSDPARRARAHLLWSVNRLMLWALMAGGHLDVLAAGPAADRRSRPVTALASAAGRLSHPSWRARFRYCVASYLHRTLTPEIGDQPPPSNRDRQA
jgi:hypothetical protein